VQKSRRAAAKDRAEVQKRSRAAVFNKENFLYLNLTTALLLYCSIIIPLFIHHFACLCRTYDKGKS
jgi:hypothetical protein